MKLDTLVISIFTFLLTQIGNSQIVSCFEIESILVNGCNFLEGQNEMVRFTVGPDALNTSNLNVSWAVVGNTWTGVCQNPSTGSIVAQLNATITNSCGQILEPSGGVLPENAKVILVSGYTGFSLSSYSFANLAETMYIIFHCSTNTTGNFANAGSGSRNFSMTFGTGSACSDTVTYSPSSLINFIGASVNFTPSGTASYVNYGCTLFPAYDPSWTVPSPLCSGAAIIDLNTLISGTIGGTWSGPGVTGNTFSTVGLSGNQYITYTLTPTCGSPISQTHSVSVIDTGIENPVSIIGDSIICSGSSTILQASEGASYSWNTGETTSSIEVSPVTNSTYSVLVIDTNGCSSSASQNITITPNPSVSFLPDNTAFCNNSASVDLIGGIPIGGVYSGAGVSNGSFNPVSAGSGLHPITYTYTDTNGCNNSTSAVFEVAVCTGVETFAQPELEVRPNPMESSTLVSLKNYVGSDSQFNLLLMDATGRKVFEKRISADVIREGYLLQIPDLASGTYLLMLNNSNYTTVKRLVK